MRANAVMKAPLLEFLVRTVHLVIVQPEAHQQTVNAEEAFEAK